jgi:hypothetical protein
MPTPEQLDAMATGPVQEWLADTAWDDYDERNKEKPMNEPPNYSPKNSLSIIDVAKIWAGVKIVLTGAVGAMAVEFALQYANSADLGTYGGIVTAGVLMILVNVLRKFRTDNV